MSFLPRCSFESFVEEDTTVNIDTRLSGLFPEGQISGVVTPLRKWRHIPNDKHPDIIKIEYQRGRKPKILVSGFNRSSGLIQPQTSTFEVRKGKIIINFDAKDLGRMRSSIQDALTMLGAEKTAHTSTHLPLSVSTPQRILPSLWKS